jgi:putative transposase
LKSWQPSDEQKGAGFEQPPQPHRHWHMDVSCLKVCATFSYLCGILDGYGRFLVHWDRGKSIAKADVEIILERAKERYPGVKLRIISDMCA